MELQIIESNQLPSGLTAQLLKGENVYYFSYISLTGGCGGSGNTQEHWVALTDKRFLYKSKVKELQSNETIFVEKNGIIPLEKISFIEVTKGSSTDGFGCSGKNFYELRVASSGGTSIIPIPTEEKGFAIRKAYMEINEYLKEKGEKKEQ